MSLKYFHLFFIATALGLLAFVVYWSVRQALAGNDHVGSAVVSGAGLVAGLAYLPWFLRKFRSLP